MWRALYWVLPLLFRSKKIWPILAVAVGSFLYFNNGSLSIPGLSTATGGGTSGFSFPDLSLDQYWKEPRDLLVDRVEDARDAQQESIEEFKTALEKFKEVTDFQGGELEEKYNTLNAAYEDSEDAAANIDKRISKVESAANRLLTEWREELNQYHDASLRTRAEAQFDATRSKAMQLIQAMRSAQAKSKPVLSAFKDQVLYIKHNLNMKAIASLDKEAAVIEQDVTRLVAEMEASIEDANAFIKTLLEST